MVFVLIHLLNSYLKEHQNYSFEDLPFWKDVVAFRKKLYTYLVFLPLAAFVNFLEDNEYEIAFSILEIVENRFNEFGFPLFENRNIIPDDDTTLFVCSGMQHLKDKFKHPDNSKNGSVQSCVRTNDIDLIGDSCHLTSFQMIGNFEFGGNHYEKSVELWSQIIRDLKLEVTVHVHPTQQFHKKLWQQQKFPVIFDEDCVWSDGDIGGYCCELYVNDLEIGNLVHTLGESVDVGFGLERLVQVLENQDNVFQTSLFCHDNPIISDHVRTINLMLENGIKPSGKGRGNVLRKLIRRLIPYDIDFHRELIEQEKQILQKKRFQISNLWDKNSHQSIDWWYQTHGITEEELSFGINT